MMLKVTTAARVRVGDRLVVSVDPFEMVHVAVIGGLPDQGHVYFHTRQRQTYRRLPSDRVAVYHLRPAPGRPEGGQQFAERVDRVIDRHAEVLDILAPGDGPEGGQTNG